MKPFFLLTTTLIVFSSSLSFSQAPTANIQTDLDNAKADLKRVQQDNSGLRSALYQEIFTLDSRALDLNKELRVLERAEELRTTESARLQRILDNRDAEMKFVGGILNDYINGLPSRIHAAERQLYAPEIKEAEITALAAGEDLIASMAARISVVKTGLDRIESVAGGAIFEGNGSNNGESLVGKFALIGPAAYFSATDTDFSGIATFGEAEVTQPKIIDLSPEQTKAISSFVNSGTGDLPIDGSMGKAIVVQLSEESLMDTVRKGGVVGYAILILGIVAMLLALFKFIEIQLFRVPSLRRINDILDDLLDGKQDAAKRRAEEIPGLSGKLVSTGVEHFYGKRRVLEETLFERLLAIRPKLDRFLPFLSLVAAAAPLMGLLGTVLGIIKTFKQMAIYGTGNAKSFSAGISEALITTAEGLVVAIPVLIVHGMLRSLAKGRYNAVEGIAVAMMNGTSELEDAGKPTEPVNPDEPEEDESLTIEAA